MFALPAPICPKSFKSDDMLPRASSFSCIIMVAFASKTFVAYRFMHKASIPQIMQERAIQYHFDKKRWMYARMSISSSSNSAFCSSVAIEIQLFKYRVEEC